MTERPSSYLVLASQRSGSTLLVESLRATGVAGEPLPRLRGVARGRQVLEELLRLAGHAGRAQRFHEQRAAAALRSQHQV